MALAADGSLWYWQTLPFYIENGRHLPPFMLLRRENQYW